MINWDNFKGDRNPGPRDRLLTLQKCLVRIVCGSPRISHADPLFAKLTSLKIDDLYEQSVRIFSYKLSRGMLPCAMANLICKADHGHLTRGARSNFFVGRSDDRSIKSIAPKYWNPLPQELKALPSIASFKERSKLDLLAPYEAFVCSVRGCGSCGFPG